MFKKILTGFLAATMILTSGIFAVNADSTLIDAIDADNGDGTYSVTEKNVRFLGRTYEKDGGRWFNWNNSGFEFSFYGTKAEVEIYMVYQVNIDTSVEPPLQTESSMGGHLNVYVDGKNLPEDAAIIPITSGTQWVTLVEGLDEGYHTITVRTPTWTNEYFILFTSPVNGNLRCAKRIRTDGTLCEAPEKKALTFEAIGDSITNGDATWNIDGAPVSWSTWAAYTARYFDADLSTMGISGNGVISWVMGGGGMFNLTDCYPYTWRKHCTTSGGADIQWVNEDEQVDVVMINLGTNDRSNIDNPSYAGITSENFVKAYVNMMKLARQKNPDAIFVCMLGAMGHQGAYVDIEDLVIESVNTFNSDMGEELAWYIELPECNTLDFDGDGILDEDGDGRSDGLGYDSSHPSIQAHQYYSEMIIDLLEPKLTAMGKWNAPATSIIGAQTRTSKYADDKSPALDMRFVATIDTTTLTENIEDITEIGILFAKKSDLNNAGLNSYDINLDTLENGTVTVKKANVTYLYNGYEFAATPRYRFHATITNIDNAQKFQTEYVARSFVTIKNADGTYTTRYSKPIARKTGLPLGSGEYENSTEMW